VTTWNEPADNGAWRVESEPSRDPFLYWMLPIYRVPKPGVVNSRDPKDYLLIDSVSTHAGVDIEWEVDEPADSAAGRKRREK